MLQTTVWWHWPYKGGSYRRRGGSNLVHTVATEDLQEMILKQPTGNPIAQIMFYKD